MKEIKKRLILPIIGFISVIILALGSLFIFLPLNSEVEKSNATPSGSTYWDTTVSGSLSGSGTSSDPYKILTEQDLAKLAKLVNAGDSFSGKYFHQYNDLNMSAYWWTPIGNDESKPFSGEYDGGGHIIKYVYTQKNKGHTKCHYQGLFGCVNGATIKNLGLEDSQIQGYSYVGGIVGHSVGLNISQCYNASTVSGNENVGGLVGYFESGSMENCYNMGAVTGEGDNIGGLVGYNNCSEILNCFSGGSVESPSMYTGGIAGYSDGFIRYCFVFSAIIDNGGVIAGYNDGSVDFTYFDCSSLQPNVETAFVENAGNFIGEDVEIPIVYRTWIRTNLESTLGWDLSTIWRISGSSIYLRKFDDPDTVKISITITLDKQSGTGGTTTIVATQGSSMPAITIPTRSGYVFQGYYTSTNGGGTKYYNDSGTSAHTCDFSANTTLYAYWTLPIYKVTLDKQSGSGGTDAYWYIYNTTKTINGETVYYYTNSTCTTPLTGYKITKPTRSGYTFKGYYTSKNGSGTQYVNADGLCVNNIYKVYQSDTTLYAYWQIVSTTLTVDPNGGGFVKDLSSENSKTQPDDTSKYWGESGTDYDTTWAGTGTKKDPYLITSAEELAGLSYMVYNGAGLVTSSRCFFQGVYFKQTTDIDVSKFWWQPIGIWYDRSGNSTPRYFSGNYDGDGHTVSGIFTKGGNTYANSYQGLFGYVYGDESSFKTGVINLNVIDSIIRGNYWVGGIVGYLGYYSFIENCSSFATIQGVTSVGGIVGEAGTAAVRIIKCSNSGAVSATGDNVGGIVGYLNFGVGKKSFCNFYNFGDVVGQNYVGGIIGCWKYLFVEDTLHNCFNKGSINATTNYAGGIVGGHGIGQIKGYNIYNSYNIGAVSSAGDSKGAIAGYANGYSYSDRIQFNHCYWGGDCTLTSCYGTGNEYTDTITCSEKSNIISLAKTKTWYTISSNWNTTTDYKWDFDSVWEIDTSKNDGYPRLTGMSTTYIDTDSLIVTQDYGSTYALSNPVREGYKFDGWKLTGGGGLTSAKAGNNGWNWTITTKTDSNGAVYTNYHLETNKTTSGSWPNFAFGHYDFVAGHSYELSYQIRINSLIGINFHIRHSRVNNDYYSGSSEKNHTSTTNGWVNESMTRTFNATFEGGGQTLTTNPLVEIYSGDLRYASTDSVVYDFDLKNIVVMDTTANTLAYSAQIYTFGANDGTVTAQWTEETWEDFAATSYAGGDGSQTNPWQIATAEQLGLLAKQSRSSNLSGQYFNITNNLDLSAHFWKGIGSNSDSLIFRGRIDGGLHTISGINNNIANEVYGGLIARGDGIQRNIIIKDSYFSGSSSAGAIIGYGLATIENCYIENSTINSSGSAGGIVGIGYNNSSIKNCVVRNCKINGSRAAGTIGQTYTGCLTSNCSVLNSTITGSTYANILVDTANGTRVASYGYGTVNGTASKEMWGDANAWGDWTYNSAINDGYPIQSGLFWAGGQSGSSNVYNYLKNTKSFHSN